LEHLVPFASLSEPLLGFFFFTQRLTELCAEADSARTVMVNTSSAAVASASKVARR